MTIKDYKIHYENIHPILEVKNFIDQKTSEEVIDYLNSNNDYPDECWGAICFRKYWAMQKPNMANLLPRYIKENNKVLLENINDNIQKEALDFLDGDPEEIVFSKFKGHQHPEGSYTPKHGFGPGVVACILPLNDEYSGGEFFIDGASIEMNLNARSLYLFREGPTVEHGVKQILSGTRLSLVSHWQLPSSSYSFAGANN